MGGILIVRACSGDGNGSDAVICGGGGGLHKVVFDGGDGGDGGGGVCGDCKWLLLLLCEVGA